jgi:hypothetical protein
MLGICSIYFQAGVGVGTRQMATVKDFREFADECMRWAVQAHTEGHRKAFLQMASAWTQAALRLEGVLIPDTEEVPSILPNGEKVKGR